MSRTTVELGEVDYAASVSARGHTLTCDEPVNSGGQDAGPAPYELLLGSLGACTAITLRMYAKRKQWALRSVHVDLTFKKSAEGASIERLLTLEGALDDEQRARLLEIAEKTPVTLTIKAGTSIQTRLQPAKA